jgi:predicted transport protein
MPNTASLFSVDKKRESKMGMKQQIKFTDLDMKKRFLRDVRNMKMLRVGERKIAERYGLTTSQFRAVWFLVRQELEAPK